MSDAARSANLFIVGAPRTGTTSLANWLDAHPDIYRSRPKEPAYYIRDLAVSSRITDRDAYVRCFRGNPHAAYLLDATPWYLFSRSAIPAIVDEIPDARFIVQLRNPADLLTSLHRHHIKTGYETEPRLARAVFGPRTTSGSDFRHGIDYLSVGRLGEQLGRLLNTVDHSHLSIVDFEELRRNPVTVYGKIVADLGLPPGEPPSFTALNRGTRPRSAALDRLASSIERKGFGRPLSTIGRRLSRLNAVPEPANTAPDLRSRIVEELADDIARLGELTGWDISAWK